MKNGGDVKTWTLQGRHLLFAVWIQNYSNCSQIVLLEKMSLWPLCNLVNLNHDIHDDHTVSVICFPTLISPTWFIRQLMDGVIYLHLSPNIAKMTSPGWSLCSHTITLIFIGVHYVVSKAQNHDATKIRFITHVSYLISRPRNLIGDHHLPLSC
jgi:hypothetical protein